MEAILKKLFLSERNMIWAVAINSVIIFALYFPTLEDVWWLEWLDHFFIATFLIEAAVKIRTYGWQNYWSSYWNRFDLTIVLGSVPTLLTGFLPLPDTSLLVVLRLLRLLRMVRFLRFVPNISHVLDGLGRALKASVFVIIALLFLNVLLALVSCQLYAEVAPEYFGNPVVSLYSIFQMFTVEGWNGIADAVAEKSSTPFFGGLTRMYFSFVVLLGGIFGMSLANAVFVDEMTMDNNDVLEQKIDTLHQEIQELKQLLLNTPEK